MTDPQPVRTRGRPSPALVLCRQCIQYVFEGTALCPHCGRDAREIGSRYRDEGHLALEAIQKLERALDRLGMDASRYKPRTVPGGEPPPG
jgi:hypothetical protein